MNLSRHAVVAVFTGITVAGLAGCAGPAKGSAESNGPTLDQSQTPRQQLEALAAWELKLVESGQQPTSAPLTPTAVPPGLEPDVLAPRAADHPRAFLSLTEAYAKITQEQESGARDSNAAAAPSSGDIDPEKRAAALKAYAKGRAAALNHRRLQAIIELQKAHQLDPASPQILRELAKCHMAEGQTGHALSIYEKLIELEPDNAEALFTLGLSAANRRDFIKAVLMLGRVRLTGGSFNHDPAADLLADFSLGWALRELGYDRASIEASKAALQFPEQLSGRTDYAQRLGSAYRQRGETWRAIGDAHCRLGEYEQALQAYAASAALPTGDPSALHPRVIYANLCLGRPFNAQAELLAALSGGRNAQDSHRPGTQPPATIMDRDVLLCAYLREHVSDVKLLAQAVDELYRQHPNQSAFVRAAASLRPADQARDLLKEFVNCQPRDLDAVSQLLAWLAATDPQQAVALTVALAEEHADLAGDYTDRLAVALWRPSQSLAALASLPSSIARARVEARLLAKIGALGEAWAVCAQAREQWPESRELLALQLQLAVALQEPVLIDQVLTQAQSVADAPLLVVMSQTHRALGDTLKAVETAQQAVERDPLSVDAVLELARATLAHATALHNDPARKAQARAQIDKAIQFATQAIDLAPQRDACYEVLALIYAPGGVLADTQLFRETVQRLRDANPQSALYTRLLAQEAILQRRFEHGLERLVNAYDSDPGDTQSLNLAITTWERWGKLDAAEQWLEERLAKRPGDPTLVEQWVRVQLMQGRGETAIERLKAMLAEDAEDLASRRLLENVYRVMGQLEPAFELGERRLLARPQGMRRELELAALYAGVSRIEQAYERLQWLIEHAGQATLEELASATRIAAGLGGSESRRDAMTLELARRTIERYPNAPLQVYGWALRTLARNGEVGEPFDALVRQAIDHSRMEEFEGWFEIAQALVDVDQPAVAGRVLRMRMQADASLTLPMQAALFYAAVATDIATERAAMSGNGAGEAIAGPAERSIELVRWLETLQGEGISNLSDARVRAGALYQVSIFYSLADAKIGEARLLREAMAHDPENAMVLNNLGYMQLEQGVMNDELVQMIEKAHRLLPDEPNILDTIGWLRYMQGRFEDQTAPGPDGQPLTSLGALSLITRSAELGNQSSPTVLDHLGDVHWRLGNKDEAIEAWRKVVELIDRDGFREQVVSEALRIQRENWRLVIVDPRDMFERQYGSLLWKTRQKLLAAQEGDQPPIARTWAELEGR